MLQAKKEGNAEIAGKLEEALRIAMAEKQKHLRPEIRLLNDLMQIKDDSERLQVGSPSPVFCPASPCMEYTPMVDPLAMSLTQTSLTRLVHVTDDSVPALRSRVVQ